MNDEFDMGGQSTATPETLNVLHRALDEAIGLQSVIDQLDADMKAAKKQLHTIRTGRIPDLMATLQIDELVRNEYKVKVSDFISGSLPSDEQRRQKAIEWLEAHGGAEIIKTTLKADFDKKEHNLALSIAASMEKKGVHPVVENGVHAQTLQSFARERIKNGEEIDTELLGLFTGRVAKITQVKQPKPRKQAKKK